jgi:hypothetical protein
MHTFSIECLLNIAFGRHVPPRYCTLRQNYEHDSKTARRNKNVYLPWIIFECLREGSVNLSEANNEWTCVAAGSQ